jgi:RNA-directed DNA polymerase
MISELEFEKYWSEWSEKEESNYKSIQHKSGKITKKYLKKGYTHFDNKFWFPEHKGELKKLLKNGLKFYNNSKYNKRIEWWAFNPFLKILVKTPRYKFQNDEGHYKSRKIKREVDQSNWR